MTDLAPRTRLNLGPGAELRPTGLVLADDLPFERWEQIGQQLVRTHSNVTKWLAQWLYHGKERYGRRYEAAIERTGLSYQTCANLASVAGRIYRWREGLSFGHHETVAALDSDEQVAWLERAEKFNWTREDLRERVRRDHEIDPPEPPDPPPPDLEQVRLTAPATEVEAWRSRANDRGLDVAAWAVAVLNEAAK